MKQNEIMNTSIRTQYWLERIKHSEDVLQPCRSLDEAVSKLDKYKPEKDRMSPLDIQCLRHAVEVSPIDCPLTRSMREV